MIKEFFIQHKKTIIISLIITLLPIAAGLILWDKLPDMVATHFDSANVPNGWSSKGFAVIGIPAILAALELFCIVVCSIDPKKKNMGFKGIEVVLWIMPATSILVSVITLCHGLGADVRVGTLCCIFIGVMLIVLGNYLPKNGQNFSFGVRTSWALSDEENWNRTNRAAGYAFIIGGIVIILTSWFQKIWIMAAVIALIVIIPIVYSFILYRKTRREHKEY